MTKKLESVFNLPSVSLRDDEDEIIEETENDDVMSNKEIHALLARADKIDKALPQVSGMSNVDEDFDRYAKQAMIAFDDLLDKVDSIESPHMAALASAANSMLNSALTAKMNKINSKLNIVKQQISKAKLDHEREKLEFYKERFYAEQENDPKVSIRNTVQNSGVIVATRTDIIREMSGNTESPSEE